MKKFILMMLFVILFLTACSEGNADLALEKVSQDVILYTKIKNTQDHNDIVKAIKEKVTLQDFCKRFDITQYKTYQAFSYVVCKTTDGLYVISFDSEDADCGMEKIRFSSEENHDKVAKLHPGLMLGDVKAADPDGRFPYLHTSWSGYVPYSVHCFKSGICYRIRYNSDYVIEEIIFFTI